MVRRLYSAFGVIDGSALCVCVCVCVREYEYVCMYEYECACVCVGKTCRKGHHAYYSTSTTPRITYGITGKKVQN